MLQVENLHASVEDKEILKGLTLNVKPGEVHAIMGPNGSGKSTLTNVLAGRNGYTATSGSITYEGKDLTELAPEDRARAGIFLAFQYPVEIPGVSNIEFLRASLEEIRAAQGKEPYDAVTLLRKTREACQQVDLDQAFLRRGVNRSEEHTSELQSRFDLVCRLLLE